MAKLDLSALVLAAQAGNGDAMNELMEKCYRDLYFHAYQTLKDEDLAADVTQESCMEILTTLDKLREPAAFTVWSRRIVYHQCTRHFRQTAPETYLEENEEGKTILDRLPEENHGNLPEEFLEDQEFQAILQQLLDSLPAEQRDALMLYYYENLSVGQIAQIQSASEGTVKSRLNYGRKAVKTKVEEYEKKNGIRLHSIAILPLLLLLFRKEYHKAAPAFTRVGAALAGGSLTAGAAGAAASGAASGAGLSLGVKLGIAAAAIALAGGAVAGGIALAQDREPGVEDWMVGTWYEEEDPAYTLTLEKDGTLEIDGLTYSLCFAEEAQEGCRLGFCRLQEHTGQEPCGEIALFFPEEETFALELQLGDWRNGQLRYRYEATYLAEPLSWEDPDPESPAGDPGPTLQDYPQLVGTWYGTEYTEEAPEDQLTVAADGTVIFRGEAYDLCRIQSGEDYTALEEPATCYRLTLSTQTRHENEDACWEHQALKLEFYFPQGGTPYAEHYQEVTEGNVYYYALSGRFYPEPAQVLWPSTAYGTWHSLTGTGKTLTVSSDGTASWGDTRLRWVLSKDGMLCDIYSLKAHLEGESHIVGHTITYVPLKDGGSLLILGMLEMDKSGDLANFLHNYLYDVFYRPEDYPGYEAVPLTKDNWQDYITVTPRYYVGQGVDGEPVLCYEAGFAFAEGVGAASWMESVFSFDSGLYQVEYDAATGKVTPGRYYGPGGMTGWTIELCAQESEPHWSAVTSRAYLDAQPIYLELYDNFAPTEIQGVVLVPTA